MYFYWAIRQKTIDKWFTPFCPIRNVVSIDREHASGMMRTWYYYSILRHIPPFRIWDFSPQKTFPKNQTWIKVQNQVFFENVCFTIDVPLLTFKGCPIQKKFERPLLILAFNIQDWKIQKPRIFIVFCSENMNHFLWGKWHQILNNVYAMSSVCQSLWAKGFSAHKKGGEWRRELQNLKYTIWGGGR